MIISEADFKKERWVAFFDILGVSSYLKKEKSDFNYAHILQMYEQILANLKIGLRGSRLLSIWFSDCFIIYSRSSSLKSYAFIQSIAKQFLCSGLTKEIPMRGAISFGRFCVDRKNKIYFGNSLIDAHKEAENQNWIGLIITKKAVKKIRQWELNPAYHNFVKVKVPNKKNKNFERFAYTFHAANKRSMINKLEQMKNHAPSYAKIKYANTVKHIKLWDSLS